MARPGLAQQRRWSYPAHIGAASLLALALYLYVVSTGLAGTSDTYHYLYAARTLRESGALIMPDGSPFWLWPPLFPVVLRFSGAPGPVLWLNGLAVLATLVAWSLVGRRLLPAGRLRALPWLLALNSPLLAASKFLWSEALYSGLLAGYVLLLLGWLRRGGWRWGLAATLLGGLLPLQRFAGAFVLVGVGAGLAWPGTRAGVRPGRLAQAVHLLGAMSGLLLWQLHRWPQSLTGSPTDRFVNPPLPIKLTMMSHYGYVLARWLVPGLPLATLAWGPALGWCLVLAAGLALGWPRAAAALPGRPPVVARLLYLVLLATVALLVISAWRGRSGQGVDEAERYLMPLYPAVLVLVLLAWPTRPRWAIRLGPWLLGAWLLGQGGRIGHVAYRLRPLPPADTRVYNSVAK